MASQPKIKPRLVIIEGKDKGKIIALSDGTAIIGRSKGDVVIQDARVSRSHIAIHYDSKTEKLSFTDLKSLNGTTVNGVGAESGELHDGDKLQLGNTVFDCQLSAALDEETSVSKIKDQLKKQKDELRAHPKSEDSSESAVERSGSKQEPNLLPLDNSLKEKPATQEKVERKAPAPTPKAHARRKRLAVVSGLRAGYLKLPRRARMLILVALLTAVGLTYLQDRFREGSKGAVEKTVASINRKIAQNELDKALSEALKLKDGFPNDSRPHLVLGNIYALQEKNELAIDAYVKAHQLSPAIPVVHVRLARILLRSGFSREAQNERAHIDTLIREGTEDRDFFVEAANLFLDHKELEEPPEKALIMAKALQTQIAPKATIGYKLEAQALFQSKQNQEALQVLSRALGIDPKDEWLLENTAYAQLSLRDTKGALATVEKWIDYHPTVSKALLVMAYLKLNDGNAEEARPYVDRILDNGRLNPKDSHLAEAMYLKGQLLWKEQRLEEAGQYFRQACEAGFQKSCNPELASAKGAPQQPNPPSGASKEQIPEKNLPTPRGTSGETLPQGAP